MKAPRHLADLPANWRSGGGIEPLAFRLLPFSRRCQHPRLDTHSIFGGSDKSRTCDLLRAKELLSQLSYRPIIVNASGILTTYLYIILFILTQVNLILAEDDGLDPHPFQNPLFSKQGQSPTASSSVSKLVVPVGFEPTLLGNLPMRPYKDRVLTITLWDQWRP
jgi:hypothetical protein